MRYSSTEVKEFDVKRQRCSELKKEIQDLIYPNREYICYFTEYFPQWNTRTAKFKIRDTWSGRSCNSEVIKMMEYIVEHLKNKK